MHGIRTVFSRLKAEQCGNIGVTAGLVSPLLIVTLALGVDYGNLTLQQKELQQAADLAAIVAASNLSDPQRAAYEHLAMNGLEMPIAGSNGILTADGMRPLDLAADYPLIATVTPGRYTADPELPVDARFVSTNTAPDAVKVHIQRAGNLYFASAFADPPRVSAVGTAAAHKIAAFSIGTRLASLHDGILNAVLSGLLGTSVDLDVMDYRALLSSDIEVLGTIDALAADINMSAATYDDVVKTDITLGSFIHAIIAANRVGAQSLAALKELEKAANRTSVKLKLSRILDAGPYSQRVIGTADNLDVTVGLFEVVSAAASAANGKSQLALDLGLAVPGLAAAKLNVAVGEPPVESSHAAVGGVGTTVRTAQTRLSLELTAGGSGALAGLKVRLPLYLEVAHGEARLAEIHCRGQNGDADARVEAVPGVVELALGDVDTRAFANFGTKPRATKAKLVSSALVNIEGIAYGNATNLEKKMLTFTPTDIAQKEVKTVATSQTLTTLQFSLLRSLDADIHIAGLTLGTPKAVAGALSETLANLTIPADLILYNTLLAFGIRIGEADIRVSYASCRQPVLVQ